MSITLRIFGWVLMVLAGLLELTNLFMLLSRPNWGFIELLINTGFWVGLFVGGYYLNRVGKRMATGSLDQTPP